MIPVFSALANGAIASIVVTGTVWLVMRLALRQRLNASTRYALWAATLAATLLLPICYVGAPHTATPGRNVAAPIVSMEALPEAPYRITPSAARVSTIPSSSRSFAGVRARTACPSGLRPDGLIAELLPVESCLSLSWVLLDRRRAWAVPPSMQSRELRLTSGLRNAARNVPKSPWLFSDEIAIPDWHCQSPASFDPDSRESCKRAGA